MLESALKVSDMVDYCRQHNMPAFALCDHNNMFMAAEFSKALLKNGIQPILGLTLDVALPGEPDSAGNHAFAPVCLLAKNEVGYRHLSVLSTDYYLKGHVPVSVETLCDYNEGLILLTGGAQGYLQQHLLQGGDGAKQTLETLQKNFTDRLYIELTRHGTAHEKKTENYLLQLAHDYQLPVIASNHCHYRHASDDGAWRVLKAIGAGEVIDTQGKNTQGEYYLKSPEQMRELFADIPEALSNAVELAQRCSFILQEQPPELPAYHVMEGETEQQRLENLSQQGLDKRLQKDVFPYAKKNQHEILTQNYQDRLRYELEIITSKGFAGYFLIVEDFIRWAKNQAIPVGPGRGSGAGSLVAWVLEITDLDPIRWGLLFERFLNPERLSMPDFDIDFCQDRRGEVINYVKQTYGEDRVAQIITFGTLKPRACVRDVGRVMGMPYPVIDKISKLIPDFTDEIAPLLADGKDGVAQLKEMFQNDGQVKILLNLAQQLEGLYRHASTHAAGVVIANKPLIEIVPLYHDGNSENLPATQFSMKYVESTGLVKFDFLGLRTLSVIQKAVEMIKINHDKDIEIAHIKLDEKPVYQMLAQGDSFGVFQLESSGMRDVLKNMQPDRFEDLIAAVALYRPGPMENIPTYNARKNGREQVAYLHPLLEEILSETYGIPVYQEQVMQMAGGLAGYSLGAGDKLRRAMGKKDRAEMEAERKNFIDGAQKNHQIPQNLAEKIFNEMEAFAGYGFNKSHAAAYAMVAYQTAWLKWFYPLEYYAAMLSYETHNTAKIAQYKTVIAQQGIEFLPPDINESAADFVVGKQENSLRYALCALKNAGEDLMHAIVSTREQGGSYQSLADFAERNCHLKIGQRALETMAKAGAFDSLTAHRAQGFEAIPLMLAHARACLEQQNSMQNNLFFDAQTASPPAPALPEVTAWAHHDLLNYELDAVGFYLSDHPLSPYKEEMERIQAVQAANIEQQKGVISVCGVVNKMRKIRTRTGKVMGFVEFSDMSGQFEIALFEEELNQYQELLDGLLPLLLKIEVGMRQDQQGQDKIRLRLIEMGLLDKSLAENLNAVELSFQTEEWLDIIHKILQQHGQAGSGQILLKFPVEDKKITLNLAEQYHLSPGLLKAFRSAPGIEVSAR